MLLIKNAKIISHSTKGNFNIYIEEDKIIEISKIIKKVDKVIDAKDLILIPGIIDMHTHLREPGFEYKETIYDGLRAAVHGGVTTLGIMPNTNPAMDNLEILNLILEKSKTIDLSNVILIPSVTKQRKGIELNDLDNLGKKGFTFFSDDGDPIFNDEIMFKALNIVKKFNGVIINHCENKRFYNMDLFESLMVARDIELSKYINSHVHIAHISTKNTLDLIKYAKLNKLKVSSEVTFHHLLLEKDEKNTLKKINPPLQNKNGIKYLIDNLDYIDIIVSDHAPHTLEEKNTDYKNAPNGISGLDIFFPAIYTISKKYNIDLEYLIEKITYNPSKIFNLKNKGDIKEGYNADLVIVDINKNWDRKIFSKGKNIPYKTLNGRVIMTVVNGKIKYKEDLK
ncbi:dihydroorotase [Marinitoga sp. 38H-ov]|uniref:dihydroorotase n=1 Tax=Marinitoga sp. 38H-ov TaxID=1755814 RepID=UPI0013EA8D13|nr:dihydroorotase [Marinitoga sp. 38H-ov]KAF2956295.1 hypothetical protein AS160_06170 [Marinitoga sp. 38H-ov]